MPTIKLKVSNKIYEQLIRFLKGFSKDEYEIIPEDPDFQANQQYLQSELKEMDEGNAEFKTWEEVNERLTHVIRNYS